ncbi:MAG: AI-2E family transporter [Nitriliruptoraceae bacterium]
MDEQPTAPPEQPLPARGPEPPLQVLRIELASRTIWQTIGAILATVVLVQAGLAARGLLSMLALSFFFSLALDPAVRWLVQRYRWRRGAAVGVIYLAGVSVLLLMVLVLVPAIGELGDRIAENGAEWFRELNSWTTSSFGFPLTSETVAGEAGGLGAAVAGFGAEPFGELLGLATTGIGLVFNLATVAMFTFYLTADAPRVKRAVLRLFNPRTQERIGWTWDQAIVQTGGYFYSRLILMAINGAGFLVTMLLVGLPLSLALPLAAFGGFVSVFIPAIGTYIGAAVPILLTLAFQGLVSALVVLGYAVVYQQIENYWLSPRISANTMSLNGAVAFGAALAGGAIAGAVGAFVALPVAALISATITNNARSYEVVYHSAYDDQAQDAPS